MFLSKRVNGISDETDGIVYISCVLMNDKIYVEVQTISMQAGEEAHQLKSASRVG